jgi:hypothetical protein
MVYNTYMSKLTLSVDEQVVRRSKRYAAQKGTSLSRLVEQFLDILSRPPRRPDATPVLGELRGFLRKGGPDDYRQHLVEKYR